MDNYLGNMVSDHASQGSCLEVLVSVGQEIPEDSLRLCPFDEVTDRSKDDLSAIPTQITLKKDR